MNKQLSSASFGVLYRHGLIVLLLFLSACASPATPAIQNTSVAPEDTSVPLEVELAIQTDQQEIAVGHPVAIVMSLNPPAAIAEATWTVLSGKGDLQEKTNDVVIFTPSEESELTLIQVQGQTENGDTFQQTTSFRVVATTPVAQEDPTQAPAEEQPAALVTQATLKDGETVNCENFLQGTYDESVTDQIWPVIYVASRYHFQDDNGAAPLKDNGKWFGTVRFGDCTQPPNVDKGKAFQLFVVTANPSCQDAIEAYFKKARATGSYPGLPEIPDGCEQVGNPIVVIRK